MIGIIEEWGDVFLKAKVRCVLYTISLNTALEVEHRNHYFTSAF